MANRKIKESFAKTKFSTTLKNICGDKVIATADTIADLDYKATLTDGTVTEGAYQSEVNKLHADAIEELQKSKTSVNFNTKDIVLNENTSKYEFANPGDAIIARGVYDADGNETDVLDTTQFEEGKSYIINRTFKVTDFTLPTKVVLLFKNSGCLTSTSTKSTARTYISGDIYDIIETDCKQPIFKGVYFKTALNGAVYHTSWYDTDGFQTFMYETPEITAYPPTYIVDWENGDKVVLETWSTWTNKQNLTISFIGVNKESAYIEDDYNVNLSIYSQYMKFENCTVLCTQSIKKKTYKNCNVSLNCTQKQDGLGYFYNSILYINSTVDLYMECKDSNISSNSSVAVSFHSSSMFLNCDLDINAFTYGTFLKCRLGVSNATKVSNSYFDGCYFTQEYPSTTVSFTNCKFFDCVTKLLKENLTVPVVETTSVVGSYNTNSFYKIPCYADTEPYSLSAYNLTAFRYFNTSTNRTSIWSGTEWVDLANLEDIKNCNTSWKIIE